MVTWSSFCCRVLSFSTFHRSVWCFKQRNSSWPPFCEAEIIEQLTHFNEGIEMSSRVLFIGREEGNGVSAPVKSISLILRRSVQEMVQESGVPGKTTDLRQAN